MTKMKSDKNKIDYHTESLTWYYFNPEIRDKTLDLYGIEKQSLVAMEEKTKPLEFKGLRHNLIEEMADVIICMDQLKEYYNITHAEIQINIDSKQARQRRRLAEE